jgi:glutamine synthetase
MKVFAEYIWIDGTSPTRKLRSKTKVLNFETLSEVDGKPIDVNTGSTVFPSWGFDGSSTFQAEGHFSDCVLKPVRAVRDPIRKADLMVIESGGITMTTGSPHYLVLCEVFSADGTPHRDNTRAGLRKVLEGGAASHDPLFGIEQEYTFFKGGWPLGWPQGGYPPPQGPFYCGVGADEVFGRNVVEAHMKACADADLLIAGINAEVMPGQWEFQIGAGDPLTVADHLWFARWLLYRIAEDHGITATLHPKPVQGDWNGAGAHTNFSTKWMRASTSGDWVGQEMDDTTRDTNHPLGMAAIEAACVKLGEKHLEHIELYGHGIRDRLTGKHETCPWNEFRWGVGNRGASIRIPLHVQQAGKGYLEDRRPCANVDPYVVTAKILKTVCLD